MAVGSKGVAEGNGRSCTTICAFGVGSEKTIADGVNVVGTSGIICWSIDGKEGVSTSAVGTCVGNGAIG